MGIFLGECCVFCLGEDAAQKQYKQGPLKPQTLGCGHKFCHGCLVKYFTKSWKEFAFPLSCPRPGCRSTIPLREQFSVVIQEVQALEEQEAVKILTQLSTHYDRATASSPDGHPWRRKCPRADCPSVLRLPVASQLPRYETEGSKKLPVRCTECSTVWYVVFNCNCCFSGTTTLTCLCCVQVLRRVWAPSPQSRELY